MIQLSPIGILRTPFTDPKNMPIQPTGAIGISGTLELLPEFADGLRDLDGFSHIILLYHFHKAQGHELLVTPFLDKTERGVFATRAPRRPNPIGLSIVRLTGREGDTLLLEDVDMLDSTPVLDIKPYVVDFDSRNDARCGWLEGRSGNAGAMRSDDRFCTETKHNDAQGEKAE
ncbi:MAG: tRNA (N6-threonylcarbamoyladenosine(37)-N6)-methyltransferase TrmO [Desulfovibrionaceae bacterium]